MIGGTALSLQMRLSYFEDAEQEILPKTFVEYNWEGIKKFFINFQKVLDIRFPICYNENTGCEGRASIIA